MLFNKLFAARQTSNARPVGSIFMPMRSVAGVNLSEDAALAYSAVFAAVKVISETVAMLPWRHYKQDGESKLIQSGSKLDLLLHKRPNDEMTAFTFKEYIVACALLWGFGPSEIERNLAGEPVALWPIHPSRVEPDRDANGLLIYRIHSEDGSPPVEIAARNMFVLNGPTKDGVTPRSIISLARESWGLGIAAEGFGASFFGNGGIPGTVLKAGKESPKMTPEAIRNMLDSFDRRHKGYSKAGRTAYVEPDFDVITIGVPQKDAQFLETRKFQITEVARWYRLPPHKIGDMEAATFSNIEQQSIDFVIDSIQPWTERLEQEGNVKLVRRDNEHTKFNLNGLMRGDSAARSEYYTKLFNMGVFSTNDIRRLEDMNPVPGGDKRFVPLNMAPLDKADQMQNQSTASALRNILIDAHQRMITKETRAVTRAIENKKNVSDFYVRHELQLVDALMPGAHMAAASMQVAEDKILKLVRAHCRRFVEKSLHDIAGGTWENWDNRATIATDQLLERFAGAV